MKSEKSGQRDVSRRSSLGREATDARLSEVELDFIELLAKGFGPMDASRSLGIGIARGAQMMRDLVHKLDARDPDQFRHRVSAIARSRPSERFVVLDC